MDFVANIDSRIYLFINHLPHTPVSDAIALVLSGCGNAWIFWALFFFLMLLWIWKKQYWFPLLFGTTIGITYVFSEVFLKNIIRRMRPSMVLDAVMVHMSPLDYSFPSTHAAVAFAVAVLLSEKRPNMRVLFFTLAVLVSFSRIYIGAHYPLDVVAGCLLGYGIGRLGILYGRKYVRH